MAVMPLRRASAPPALSAGRQRLAEAIAANAAAGERAAALAGIRDRARSRMFDAQNATQAAREAVDRAVAAAAEHATAQLLGTAGRAPQTPADARAALQAATDAEDAATAAYQSIEAEIGQIETGATHRANRVTDAAVAVLIEEGQGAIQSLVVDLDALHRQLVDKARALQWLIGASVLHAIGPKATPGTLEVSCRATSPAVTWPIWQRADGSPSAAAWEAALAALKADATAPVPR